MDLAEAFGAVWRKFRPVHGVVAHSLGATATVVALSRQISVERVALLAPPAEPTLFLRALARALGLSSSRTEGLVARARARLGGSLDALDLRKLAPHIKAELLLFHDPEDGEVPFAHGQTIAAAWPGAQLERVHQLGHRRLLKDSAVIEKAVRFLRDSEEALLRKEA